MHRHDAAEPLLHQIGIFPDRLADRAEDDAGLFQLLAERGGEKDQAERNALAGLGLTLAPASAVPGAGREGVIVAELDPDGAAAQTGLKAGDVILEAAGHKIERPADVSLALNHATLTVPYALPGEWVRRF